MLLQKNKIQASMPVVPYQNCFAKSFLDSGKVIPGRTVFNHCQIVGGVARELIRRFPASLSKKLFPEGSPLIAAAHDIGKVSPFFVEKLNRAFGTSTFPNIDPKLESKWGGHAGVSQVTLQALNVPKYIPEILGQHHGFSPEVTGYRVTDERFGGQDWQNERIDLIEELKRELKVYDWPEVKSIPQARILAGLTSVADWIGSGDFFENPDKPWKENIQNSVDNAGFLPSIFRPHTSFEEVFGFKPRKAQEKFIEQVSQPGVYVLEAPMGIGKTEAALFSAYKILEKGKASGIYFALPTQLTSNKIFERFNDFLEKVLAENCPHRPLLLHGDAWMLDTDMGEEGRPGGAWFNQAKRGLLAPFAVGTIDQALMATMNVKHGFVRAFGLAGKVVILDEVHTYDAYTGTILDALVKLLRSIECTVIILSATLSLKRREQIIGCSLNQETYPLITSFSEGETAREIPLPSSEKHQVRLKLLSDCNLAVQEALERASQGQQVIWIENTVLESQNRFLELASRAVEIGVDCGLLHSRFTPYDRQKIEQDWINQFGKPGWEDRKKQGRILIGTQVLEQSLDIDADFLVSCFAPTDMLLQRLGRLWRNKNTPRAGSATCEAWLIAPSLRDAIESPEQHLGSTAFVYNPYVLCRSLEVWASLDTIRLPDDIRSLVEQTYSERTEHADMQRWLEELENGTRSRKGRNALQQLALITLASSGKTLPESRAQTRYSEIDNIEVFLVRAIKLLPEKSETLITLLNGKKLRLPWKLHRINKSQWRHLSAQLMKNVVAVRPKDAPKKLRLDTLRKYRLQHCFYLGDPKQDEAVLRVALVNDLDELSGLNGGPFHENTLEYRVDLGYRVNKTQN